MSLDVWLTGARCEHCGRGDESLYEANITHNLGAMAQRAGIYKALWRPEEIGIETAAQLIEPLTNGLRWLKENREEAEKHNAPNGWGLYKHFVPWVERYLEACIAHPTARIGISR